MANPVRCKRQWARTALFSASPAVDLAHPSRLTVRPTWTPSRSTIHLEPRPKKQMRRRGEALAGRIAATNLRSPSERERALPLAESLEDEEHDVDDTSYVSISRAVKEVELAPTLRLPARNPPIEYWKRHYSNSMSKAEAPLRPRKPRPDPRAQTPPDGLHKLLFPEAGHSPENQKSDGEPSGLENGIQAVENAIFNSLRNEIRSWIPESQQSEITAPVPGTFGSEAAVVTLAGVSPSLLDTDFYRILPTARHVEGWAGGLIKIVQARDPLSHLPLGHYFLLFHSRAAAAAFVFEARRLYALARRLIHPPPNSGAISTRGPRAIPNDTPLLTPDEKATVQRFTLCPPTVPLKFTINTWNDAFRGHLAGRVNIADVAQPLQPEALTPAKVLFHVRGRQQGRALEGGHGMTADELWLTLRHDGRERGSPWVLAPTVRQGLQPVRTVLWMERMREKAAPPRRLDQKPLEEGEQHDDDDNDDETKRSNRLRMGTQAVDLRLQVAADSEENDMHTDLVEFGQPIAGELVPPPPPPEKEKEHKEERNKKEGLDATLLTLRERRYNRFVLTFAQPAMARRFVRAWHRRAVWDGVLKKMFIVDAVSVV